MKIRDFRQDWWYEILRLVILFSVLIFLLVNWSITSDSRNRTQGNREVACAVLRIQLEAHNVSSLARIDTQKTYEENC